MLSILHRLRRDEEGQTLVLGAVSMLVLALAVMTTMNIGQAAYEKIRLQNTADATAYSLAAVQARTFNFFAYTNRAMVCHYNSALTVVAYLSFVKYLQNTLGRLSTVAQFIPYIGVVFKIIKKIIDIAVKILRVFVKIALPVLNVLNGIYFLFQLGMWAVMESQLIFNSRVSYENDPDVVTGLDISNLSAGSVMQAGIKLLNAYMVNKGIDYLAMLALVPNAFVNRNFDNVKTTNSPRLKNSAGQDKGNEGRLVMNEIINAGRHPWVTNSKDGTDFVGRRYYFAVSLFGVIGIVIDKGARTEHGLVTGMGSKNNSRHDQIYAIERWYVHLYGPMYWFKVVYKSIVIADYKKGGEREELKITEKDCCVKRVLGKCVLYNPICLASKAAALPVKLAFEVLKLIPGMNLPLNQKDYKWFGITPFMKYKPSPKWKQAFNQPQYMVLASKADDKLNNMSNTVQRVYGVDFGLEADDVNNQRGLSNKLNFEIDVTDESSFISSMTPGFNAIAVARAYYHRPGEWKEHPNFFNPFWAAKLDPVAHHALLAEVPLLSTISEFVILH